MTHDTALSEDPLDQLDAQLDGMFEHLCYLREIAGQSTFSREDQPFADGKTFFDLSVELENTPFKVTQTQGMRMSMFSRSIDRWEVGVIDIPFDSPTLNLIPNIEEWKGRHGAPRMHSTPDWGPAGRTAPAADAEADADLASYEALADEMRERLAHDIANPAWDPQQQPDGSYSDAEAEKRSEDGMEP